MRRRGSVLLFAAISVALHLAWVVWMPAGQRPSPAEMHWVEMTFEAPTVLGAPAGEPEGMARPSIANEPPVSEHASTRAPTHPQPPTAQPSEPQPAAQQVLAMRPRASLPTPAPKRPRQPADPVQLDLAKPAELALQPAAAEPNQAPEAVAATAPSGTAKPLAILPRSAALSLEAFAQGSSLRCGERASASENSCAPTQAETGQAAQAALMRDLNAVASHVPHLQKREPPVLKRRSDGSYAYEGGVFQALVRPDGKVEFRDTSVRAELRPSWVPFVVIADINDLVERDVLSRELYSAEKQWLLDETRELRGKLASESRRRELQDANRALERTLRGILDDPALSVAQKHEAMFLVWQDCGEDAQAQAHRRAVDSFVRRYMPDLSALAFRSEELERFNNSRPGLQRFDPYHI